MVLSTSWGGELVTLVRQASERRLFERSTFVLPVAEASMQPLGRTMPAGHVIGARGDHWNNHPKPKNPEAMKSFVDGYRQRFNEYPIYPCHHMAQAFSALQAAYAKAIAAKSGGWPNDQELADAFRGLTFDTPTSTITLREDGQGLEDQLVGLSSHGDRFPFAVPRDMVIFPAAMVSTPVGQKSVDWLKSLKPDILAQVPAPSRPERRRRRSGMGEWFAENGLLLGLAALDGLAYAALVFMVAVGLNLVFGVLRIVNVAHGSLFAIGAYAAASIGFFFTARGLPPAAGFAALLLGAALVGGVLGPLIERACCAACMARRRCCNSWSPSPCS